MIKTTYIRAGLYEYRDYKGRRWIIEHVTPADGFSCDEWHCGTSDDPHADQYPTFRRCREALTAFLDREQKANGFTVPLTQAQQKALHWLKRELMYHQAGGRIGTQDRYEFKQWDVTVLPTGTAFLVSEIGLKGDEGTAASIFCRDHRHIAIGPRGGMRLVNARHPSRARGCRVTWALTR